jgi:DNA-binding LacI/PurR family transcriptional regulator
MVRLKDIAERAGVTVMTVSRALRGARDVSPSTRERVRILAAQMGYVPDATARGLRTRSSGLLGVLIPGVTDPVQARVLLALEEQARGSGFDLLLGHTLRQPELEESGIRRLLGRRIEGLFLLPVYRLAPTAPVYRELRERGTRVVLLGQRAPFCESFPFVAPDDGRGAQEVARHLIELGHRRIAFFAGPGTSPAARERLEGHRRALREAGLPADDTLVFNAGTELEDGANAALRMINEGVRPTAIQGVNDLVAMGAANVLLRQGWRVPGDISVAGYGNILMSEHYRVPLTTLRQPKYRLGVAAFEMMQALLRGEPAPNRRLPGELAVRESTAPPPDEAGEPMI